MGKRLEGKNAIVTAAGQGIGKATAITFHNEGANVFATDINEKTLKSLKEQFPKIDVFKLDSTNKEDVDSYCSHMNNIDILFNAVGFFHHVTILDCEEKDLDFSFNTNIKSMYFMCKAVLPKMLEKNCGSIINVASVASSIKGLPNRFVYGASKAAVIGLTKSIASDFVKQKIRCNAIAPGTVFTPSWEDRVKQSPDPVKAKNDFIARQPMERLGTAQEIADFAIYLASDESTFTTGNTFSVDGGMTI